MLKTEKQKIGDLGEEIAVKHLVKLKYGVLDRNYRQPWGELDIIAQKNGTVHFVEVKTVSVPNADDLPRDYLPEENVHQEKMRRMNNAIQTYLEERKISPDTVWQIDVMAVFLDLARKKAKIRITEDI